MNRTINLKHLTILLVSILLVSYFSSCKKDDGSISLNKWKLIEQYSDPGDGSGEFNPVESNKTLEFFSNGTVVSNGSLCNMSIETDGQSTATFTDSTLITQDCELDNFAVYYQILDDNMILWYPCIEGCAQKYQKIE